MVSTAAALPVKHEWVRIRPKTISKVPQPLTRTPEKIVASWPSTWQLYYPKLAASKIAASTLDRYRSSIDRCSQLVNDGVADERLGFLTAYQLAQALLKDRKRGKGKNRPITIANYLDGLIALGTRGGADSDGLSGMRLMRDDLKDQASAVDKIKLARISKCSIPDDHIDPRRSALFMARSVLREARDGDRTC